MKATILFSVFVSAALAASTLPASAAQKTPLVRLGEALVKRAGDPNAKRGFCVCMGGDMNRRAGEIALSAIPNGGNRYYIMLCEVKEFDLATGELDDTDHCDEAWVPLPN